MPHLPFTPSPSPPKSTPSPPSIVLHPAAGIQDHSDKSFPSNLCVGKSSSKRQLFQSNEDAASLYRQRYAQYLAATFNMSLEAALAEADAQLAPRRSSEVSEVEAFRENSI